MRRMLAVCFGLIALSGCGEPEPIAPDTAANTLSAPAGEGFRRAFEPVPIQFPADHGPHRDFRDEWWYVTGNLDGPDGRRFGFQITFFRHGIQADAPQRDSHWAARDVQMAHFTLTDATSGRFKAFERHGRTALGLAGAEGEPLRIWLDDWTLASERGSDWPWRLQVTEGDYALDLRLNSAKPMVLQGRDGLSQKSREPGNASYYYSGTRLRTDGRLRFEGREYAVTGLSWLDREWSTSALGPDQVGWDWFSLQFEDNTELMYYRLRTREGRADPASAGTWIAADGRKLALSPTDVELEPLTDWIAPDDYRYPSQWRITVKPVNRSFIIRPVVEDQELRFSVRYWEGAVDAIPDDSRTQVQGRGYMELTGYAKATGSAVSGR